MRVLLLGASGRTGRRLVDELTTRGHELVVVVRQHSPVPRAELPATGTGQAADGATGPTGPTDVTSSAARGRDDVRDNTSAAARGRDDVRDNPSMPARCAAPATTASPAVMSGARREDWARDLEVHRGDVTDVAVLAAALASTRDGRALDAVVSALGPRPGADTLHRDLAIRLVAMMPLAGVPRFIGVSGAGVNADGDQKSLRDQVISAALQWFGGAVVADKQHEYDTWAASELDWTLVRPPRLTDTTRTTWLGAALAARRVRNAHHRRRDDTGAPHCTSGAGYRVEGRVEGRVESEGRVGADVEHHAHRSPRRAWISRLTLARFIVDELEHHRYPKAAPLIAGR